MVHYHFKPKEGSALGPIDAEEFQRRLEAGEITDQTMVWRSGLVQWTTYAALRTREQELAKLPPPMPATVTAHEAAPQGPVKFLACGTCQQEWPESLLFSQGSKPICGNCQRKQLDEYKKNPAKYKSQLAAAAKKNSAAGSKSPSTASQSTSSSNVTVDNGWGSWLLRTLGMAVLMGSMLFGKAYLKNKGKKAGSVLHQQVETIAATRR